MTWLLPLRDSAGITPDFAETTHSPIGEQGQSSTLSYTHKHDHAVDARGTELARHT
jgi:hypothetical protein